MIPKLKHCLIAVTMGMTVFTATSQTTTVSPLENLFRLEGSWAGAATLILEGNTFNFTYFVNFKKNDESSGMYMEEWFSHPDLGSLKGYNVIGYNARDEKIHWFSVDNFGTCHDHLGYWKTNDHFYMEATEKHQGKKFEEKIDFIFINENELSLHLVATIGGKLFEDVVVIFKKQSVPVDKPSTETENNVVRVKSNIAKEINTSYEFKVFPNPAKGQISFQLPANIAVRDLKLSIFNAAGQTIKNDPLQTTITNVSLKTYKTGIYFYKIMNKGQILHTGKFIIQ